MRRHLGYDWDEWGALPWHKRRAYLTGLRREFHGEEPTRVLYGADGDAALRALGINFN